MHFKQGFEKVAFVGAVVGGLARGAGRMAAGAVKKGVPLFTKAQGGTFNAAMNVSQVAGDTAGTYRRLAGAQRR